MEKKNLPNGWGDSDEDDDYGYDDFNDDDESDFPFKKVKESAPDISSGNTGLQDEQLNQERSVGTQQSDTSIKSVQTNHSCQSNSAKKSKAVSILIAIIVVLAVAGGILAGILILKNKKAGEKEITVSESSDAEIQTNETSSGDSTSMTTETNEIQRQTTEAVTESKTEETQPTSVSDTYSADEISAMFSAYISENPDPNRTYTDSDYGYALIDLNNDGTQELLITEGEREKGSPWIIGVYTIKNSKLTLLMGFDLRFPGSLYEDNIISCFSSLGQGGGTAFYKYISGDSLEMIDIISYDYSSGTKVMYHNSDVITEAESYSILAQYKAIEFEEKPLNVSVSETKPVTSSASSLSDDELGIMYNAFYIQTLFGYVSGGYIEDYNGDGIDDLIYKAANTGYLVACYNNGTLEEKHIPNTDYYGYDEPLSGMKSQYYSDGELPQKCLEKAVQYGYTANQDFSIDLNNLIGYVKTTDINSTLNLRSAPSTNSDVITQLPNGIMFNVIDSFDKDGKNMWFYDNPSWYYITVIYNKKTYMGYVSADYVVAWDNAI